MQNEARAILDVFRRNGPKAGDFIHFGDFGEAMIWKEGFIRDESVRKALETLIAEGYVDEMLAGLTLTEKGQAAIDGA